jgi:outer membrane biosynthesis protein TonB
MQESRTTIALALVAALGFGTVAAGCGNESASSQETAAPQRKSTMIDSFETGSASSWKPFTTGGSTISEANAPLAADGATASTEITYSVQTGGSAGLERDLTPPQSWPAGSSLTMWVYGRGTGHSFLVQVYDAGNERWESRFPVDFTGWKQISISLASLTAASWQPPTARVDGVRDFDGVNGIALVPSEVAGSGVVNVDELALAPTSASDAGGATAPTATPSTSVPPTPSTTTPTTTSTLVPPTPSTTTPTTTAPSTTTPTTTATTAPTTTPTATPAPTPTAMPSTAPATTPTATPATTPTAAPATTPTATPATTATPSSAGPATGSIIPLYTSPTDPSWAAVAAAKAAHPAVPILAVVNPANGPGAAASADYAAGIAKLTAAGVKVIGYVHTSWGNRPATELEAEMGQWKSWYPGVTGIFFDEMANAAGHESYYSGLSSFAKGHGFDFTIGNPGSDSSPTYVGTEDVILIYENSGLPSVSALGGWHSSYGRNNFGVIPYAVGSLDTSFIQSAKSYVGYIYLQSDNLPNPWDSVPPYLSDLLTALD